MRKILILSIVLLCVFTFRANCQNNSAAGKSFEKGDLLINPTVYAGRYYNYNLTSTPSGYKKNITSFPLGINIEFGFHELLSGGVYFGYHNLNFQAVRNFNNYGWNFVNFGVRGSFHYLPVLNEQFDAGIDDSKLDLYVTFSAGYELGTYFEDGISYNFTNRQRFYISPVLGVRYFFLDNIGLFLEAGRGSMGLASFGVTFKF